MTDHGLVDPQPSCVRIGPWRIAHGPLVLLGLQCAALVSVGIFIALLVNCAHPMGLPLWLNRVPHPGIPEWVWNEVKVVRPPEAYRLWQTRRAIFVDTRRRRDFEVSAIPGAVCLPYHEFSTTFPTVEAHLPRDAPILMYCYGSHCGLSMRVAKRLLVLGYRNLLVLEGGIDGWQQAGYSVKQPKKQTASAGLDRGQ